MTGRGIDQVLPHPSAAELYESHVENALDYVRLAESVSGPLQRPVSPAHVWGEALAELARRRPDIRIINLETSVTSDGIPEWKGINYRMHPANLGCLSVAGVDCCVLANNHVLDWGEAGLIETLECLRAAGMATTGAGRDLGEAESPALFELAPARLRVFGFAAESSGASAHWAAGPHEPGICLLRDLSEQSLEAVQSVLEKDARPGDVTVVSLHWGGNWDYAVPEDQRRFAHALVDFAGADVVYGHSSHHPKGIEVYRQKLILYGCGDLINDYEGIPGYELYRPDLGLMYFGTIDPLDGDLIALEMVPMRRRGFSLEHATHADTAWLSNRLDEQCAPLGTRLRRRADDVLELRW
jgi:poly-gamma-glutamate capsule biosynthesis protein CapA/YwtB (metallophosphatase superfamily)